MDIVAVVVFLPVCILVLAAIFDAFHNYLSWRRDFIWVFRLAVVGAIGFVALVVSNDLILRTLTGELQLDAYAYQFFIVPVGFILGTITGTMYALHRKNLFREIWRLGLACGLPLMLIFTGLFIFAILEVLRPRQYFWAPRTAQQRFAEIALVAIIVGIPAIWSGLLVWWALNSGRAVSRSGAAASLHPDVS